ncbi:MAG: PAS domain-containing protein [Litoreibacter sp.]
MDKQTDNDTVVPMWMHQAEMDTSPLTNMYNYWEDLRAGRLAPLRSEVDPRAIASSLENGFILERVQPGSVRFRLAGSHLSDLMGMEVRGMPLRAFVEPAVRSAFTQSLEAVFEGPETHEYRLVSRQKNSPKMAARILLLPMKSDSGEVDRALGCMVSDGNIGLAPRRFRVTETRITSLLTGKSHREMADSAPAGFAEEPKSFTSEPRPRPQRADGPPKLRLVKSDTW